MLGMSNIFTQREVNFNTVTLHNGIGTAKIMDFFPLEVNIS